ncbi:hypothetical protein ACEWY4_026237 [Coilia grayii]|uniref:Clarin-3 n=1 Tax=Coilia grayii TaxID=363190 RepID=A0ABD1IUP7_9TELE
MPSLKKTLHFLASAWCCAGGVALLGYGMAVNWSSIAVDCKSSNGTGLGAVTMGLFEAIVVLETCPFFDSENDIKVMQKMEGVSLVLQYIVVAFLVLALIGSAGSILITLYNSISNPYETYMGPVGLYTCGGCSVVLSFLAIIIYVSNVHLGEFAVAWIRMFATPGELSNTKVTMELGYFLVLPYIAVNLLAILLVYLYVHAAYTRQKEQQKPTEDAPKEIMMY